VPVYHTVKYDVADLMVGPPRRVGQRHCALQNGYFDISQKLAYNHVCD